jgi:hypothetical protein
MVATTDDGHVVIQQETDTILMDVEQAEEVQRLLGNAIGEAKRIRDSTDGDGEAPYPGGECV